MHKHILIPTDGFETARKGVDFALSLARDLDAKVTVLTVTDPYSRTEMTVRSRWKGSDKEMNEFNRRQKEEADKILHRVKADAGKIGGDVALVPVSEARPAEAILHTAGGRGAHLIVIGSHGRRGVNRLLLGSQTAEVLAHAAIRSLSSNRGAWMSDATASRRLAT